MYYFDLSGNSLSIPNGLQKYYERKNYYFMIKTIVTTTGQNTSITYNVILNLPSGENPIPSVQYVEKLKNFNLFMGYLKIKIF